jgi:hypothetical protein
VSVSPSEPLATRREVDHLRDDVRGMGKRIDELDSNGTRGMVGITLQISDLIKAQGEMSGRFTEHERQHQSEAQQRVIGRRWLVGMGFAGMAAMAAVITMLVDVLSHLH